MSNNTPSNASDFDIDVFKLIEKLFLFRWWILLVALLCATSAASYKYFSFKKTYTASCYILAAQPADDYFAESAAPARRYSTFDDASYEVTLKSDIFLRDIVNQKLELKRGGKTETTELVKYYKVSDSDAAVSMLRGAINLTRQKTLMVLSVTMPDAEMSAAAANALAAGLNTYIRRMLATNANANLDFVENSMNKVNRELVEARTKLIDFLNNNKQLSLFRGAEGAQKFPLLVAERKRLEQEIIMKSELYTKLVTKFELLKIEVGKETPYVNVLQYASVPLQPTPRGMGKAAAIGFILGLFLSLAVVFLAYLAETFVPPNSLIRQEFGKDWKHLRKILFLSRG